MCEGRGGVRRREIFNREVDERGEEMYANMENSEDGFKEEKILEREEMRVRIVAEVLVCGDKIGENDLFRSRTRYG